MRTFLSVPALVMAISSLSAQHPDSVALPRVVVTATRVDAPLGSRLSTVTVLDGDALRRAGVQDVADALRLVPGAAVVRSGGQGAQTSLFVRGGESDYVRVLVDGVPMNDPGGSIDLAHLSLDNVDRIEVVRGPSSVLYGTDAVTGVIQIFTRDGRAAGGVAGFDMRAAAGSHDARSIDGSSDFHGPRVTGSVAVARNQTDGFLPFNNDYRNDAASARVTVSGAGGGRATVATRLNDDVFHYPTDGSGNIVDRNSYRSDRRGSLAIDAEQPLGERLRGVASFTALEASGHTEDAPDGAADTLGFYLYRQAGSVRRRAADARLQWSASTSTVMSLGAEWSTEAQRSSDTSSFGGARSRFAADRDNRALYAQLLGERGRLSYVAGARYDDNDVFGSFRTARVAAAWQAWKGGTVRASLGTAFKAPTFLEQFPTAFTHGNAALNPERSRSWEVWAQHVVRPGRLVFSAAWFHQRFHDLIQYSFQLDPQLPDYYNAALASSRGVELEADLRPVEGVTVKSSATLLRTRVEDAGFDSGEGATFVEGHRLLRRPALSAALATTVRRWSRVAIDASVLYVGERDDRDFADFPAAPVTLDSYVRIDAAATLMLRAPTAGGVATSLLVRADNLLGASYEEVFGFGAPGRILNVGLRVSR